MNPSVPNPQPEPLSHEDPDSTLEIDPNDADRLRNQIRGQTTEHATPPRLEDEGQSGG
ncbi:MAG: hypothetical protein JO051_12065 [Acidobacteriaceae bacterium]|nr:hypothetical protein [Acidobacteriaceae bacterium]